MELEKGMKKDELEIDVRNNF